MFTVEDVDTRENVLNGSEKCGERRAYAPLLTHQRTSVLTQVVHLKAAKAEVDQSQQNLLEAPARLHTPLW